MIEDKLFRDAVEAERIRILDTEEKQLAVANALDDYYERLKAYSQNPGEYKKIPTMYVVAKEHGLNEQQLARLHKRLLKAVEQGELEHE